MSAPINKTFTPEEQNEILENGCVQFGTIKENKTKTVGWEKEQTTPLEGLETLENENRLIINKQYELEGLIKPNGVKIPPTHLEELKKPLKRIVRNSDIGYINPEDENGNENIYGVWKNSHRVTQNEEETEETEARAVASDARETIARAAEARAAQEEEEVVVAPPKEKKKRAPREPKVGSRAYKKLMPRCEFINPKSGCQCRCKCENMADTLCKKHAIVKIQCDPANWKRLLGDINEIITEILQNAFNQDASENEELHDLIRQNLDIKGINEDVDAYLDTMTKMCARKYIRSRYTYLKNKNVECDGIRLDGNACQEQCEQGWVNLVKKMKKMVSQD